MFGEETRGEPSTSSPRRVTRNLLAHSASRANYLGTGAFVVSVLYPPNVLEFFVFVAPTRSS
ncbi:hypothetical protein LX32DRAFT_645477 [Colletotrichum zoysiae]|uniref:Uncharacterized protein n=1 Tax=Colletotrichum zoysiae TaxID=1216348 RepID=A0AAD9LVT8_9PEZI|nr:hypothetical protein LX32DRAFT_645477 [Colletotrichum zoysiae]